MTNDRKHFASNIYRRSNSNSKSKCHVYTYLSSAYESVYRTDDERSKAFHLLVYRRSNSHSKEWNYHQLLLHVATPTIITVAKVKVICCIGSQGAPPM